MTEEKLIILKNNLKQNNIIFTWDNIEKFGFPYRVVNKLNSVKIKLYNTEIFLENLSIINQPWNIKHIILKSSEIINILNQNNKITINPEIMASIRINKLNEKIIAININEIIVLNNNYKHKINKPEIYLKEDNKNNLLYSIRIKELIYQPIFIENDAIKNIDINGSLANYKNININNYYTWLSNEGGIDIDNFKLNINKTFINGNAFIGMDENMDLQSSISLEANNLYEIFLILRNKTFISKNTLETSKFIIKAIEIASKASNTIPKYSINIQNGRLNGKVKILIIKKKRPYLINTKMKVNNKHYKIYSTLPIELELRNEVTHNFELNELDKFENLISKNEIVEDDFSKIDKIIRSKFY